MSRGRWIRSGAAFAAILCAGVAYAVVVGGKAEGVWELPTAASDGFAAGTLFNGGGQAVFTMKAKLIPEPGPKLFLQGRIDGELRKVSADEISLFPKYFVRGEYAGVFTGQSGDFKATISYQVSPKGPEILIGKMAGKYSDPLFGPNDVLGKFVAEWAADL